MLEKALASEKNEARARRAADRAVRQSGIEERRPGQAAPCRRIAGRHQQCRLPPHACRADAGTRRRIRRIRFRRARSRRQRLEADRPPPGHHRMGGQPFLRHQPGQRAAAGCAGAGHHLRPDGRHQYGARRTADDRRLCDVCGADAVPRLAAGLAGLVCGGGAAAGLRRDRAGRHGAGTHRHPLALWPPAGNAAGHLGHQPDADAGRTHAIRRAERGSGQPQLDVGRDHGAGRPGC